MRRKDKCMRKKLVALALGLGLLAAPVVGVLSTAGASSGVQMAKCLGCINPGN